MNRHRHAVVIAIISFVVTGITANVIWMSCFQASWHAFGWMAMIMVGLIFTGEIEMFAPPWLYQQKKSDAEIRLDGVIKDGLIIRREH